MGTKLTTVSVRLDRQASVHVDKAADVLHQSKGAFLARAGEEAAEQVLLQWAVKQYEAGGASLSELAAETLLPLERIAQQVAADRSGQAEEMYLASCHQLARTLRLPKFYRLAQKAVDHARQDLGSTQTAKHGRGQQKMTRGQSSP